MNKRLAQFLKDERAAALERFAPKQMNTGVVVSRGPLRVDIGGGGAISPAVLGGSYFQGQSVLIRWADGIPYAKAREGSL